MLDEAHFSIVVGDHAQRLGIGTELVRRLIQVAQDEKLRRIGAVMVADNQHMAHILTKLGFRLTPMSDGKVRAERDL